jgi:hypothetical protein
MAALLLLTACSTPSETTSATEAGGGARGAEMAQSCPSPTSTASAADYAPRAQCTGCHPSNFFEGTPPEGGGLPDCDVTEVEVLPCGTCSNPGYQCTVGVHAHCDFDGEGPEPVQVSPEYLDEWLCECRDGSWYCGLWNVSGASCRVEPMDAG